MKLSRQIEPVGSRVESGREVEDRVDALLRHQPHHDFVHDGRAHDHGPGPAATLGHGRQDLLAVLPRESPGVRVVEERVRALAFHGSVHGHPAGGV